MIHPASFAASSHCLRDPGMMRYRVPDAALQRYAVEVLILDNAVQHGIIRRGDYSGHKVLWHLRRGKVCKAVGVSPLRSGDQALAKGHSTAICKDHGKAGTFGKVEFRHSVHRQHAPLILGIGPGGGVFSQSDKP